ncbi:MAG TPA: hypothetical protein VNV25_16630 [Gemmatimonadaceae bacterium]|nr:hypothetical protein [Gemmatimonadaceae bacterium]
MITRVLIAVVVLAVAAVTWRAAAHAHEAAGHSDLTARVAATVPKVERAVGLPFKSPPKVEVRSKDQVRAFLERQFEDPRQARELAGTAAAFKLLGLIPDSLDLRKESENLLTEQIAGFYDPKTKVLYVIEGETDDMLDQVVPHELVHALQDQYVNLDSIENAEGDDDRLLAAQAVFEGQAVYEQLIMTGGPGIVARLDDMWDKLRETIRDNRSTMPEFAKAPPIIQEVTIFPYLSGLEFIKRYEDHFPKKVPYADLPTSTQQVLSETAFFGQPRATPLRVTLPKPSAGTVRYENTLGEFQTRVYLNEQLNDQNAAVRGAAGWAGDRYQVLDVPGGTAMIWVSIWDNPVDAAQFVDLLSQTATARFGAAKSHGTWTRGTRTVTITPVEIHGRPGALYLDTPRPIGHALVDTTALSAVPEK